MTYIERIFDATTGETTERPLTEKEVLEVEFNIKKAQEQADLQATRAAEKQAILDKLGITAEQAKLLLS